MAYGLFVAGEKLVCVFDMGGGTTDVTIMQIREGKFTVKACKGCVVGGTHMDEAMLRLVAQKLGVDHGTFQTAQVDPIFACHKVS